MIHIVITGSRDWPIGKAKVIWDALEEIYEELAMDEALCDSLGRPIVTLHHGECPYGGADLIGASWAAGAGWEVKGHPPLKQEARYYAMRNQEMIDIKPDYVLAFFLEGAGNRGTNMTYDMAKRAGLGRRTKGIWA